jgi:hypothetical protein
LEGIAQSTIADKERKDELTVSDIQKMHDNGFLAESEFKQLLQESSIYHLHCHAHLQNGMKSQAG